MQSKTKYLIALVIFTAASIASQYGSTISVPLWGNFWLPLSAFTVIPLLDVVRSFVQHYAEQSNMTLKQSAFQMLTIPLVVAFLFMIGAGLPMSIFLGAIAAVNIGGLFDIYIFRLAKRISEKPQIRMIFSNLAATLVGGAVFFAVAFTDLTVWLGLQEVNVVLRDNLVQGWLAQCMAIWVMGCSMANFVIAPLVKWLEKSK